MSCINSAKYGEFGEVYDSALRWQLTLEWLLAAVHDFFVAVIAGFATAVMIVWLPLWVARWLRWLNN